MSKVNNNDMEKSNKSHGKKSDKETHTPMLKIFKDMIQLEKNDPEKANLLKDKERNKKRKQYATSRSKSDIINRSCDSSSSDRHRASQVIDHREYDVQCHGVSNTNKKCCKRSESTESGISCALKRLATSEYTCIACLGILFTITVIAAFCVVFKSTPCAVKTNEKRVGRTVFRGRDFGDAGLKEGLEDRNDWDDSKSGRYSDLSLTDFDESSRGLIGGSGSKFSDLSRIIDVNKLNYGKSSDRLKSFYKKLLQTDDQIKNLKKGMIDSTYTNMKIPDRKKRSIKHHHHHFKNLNKRSNEKNRRNKRYSNYTLPTGFLIEKKKLMVHLPNQKKIVPKCSHAPKDSKSHETELKHPFYKHSQRLDELLDQFLDNNLPHIFGDLNFGSLFEADKLELTTRKTVSTHKKGHTSFDIITDNFKMSSPNDFFKITNDDKYKAEVLLGVTTIMSPSPKNLPSKSLLERVPNIRKLMQAYEDDDENFGYEDLKEVLTDDAEGHDDTEVKVDRNKRSYETETNPFELSKSNSPGVQIPNWKGPLPLYPDELNTMIKENKDNSNKPIIKDISQGNVKFTDIEYVEDYLTNKYDKLANMAQAYSDYGVLDEKKESKSDNNKPDNTDNRVKLSLDIPGFQRRLIDRFKKGTTESQNIYFNQPDNTESFNVRKFLNKHIKIINGPKSSLAAPKANLMKKKNKFKFDKSDIDKNIGKFKYIKSDMDKQEFPSITEKHLYEKHLNHLRIERSVENLPSNVSSDDDVERRSLKHTDETSETGTKSEGFSIEFGDNIFTNENESNKVDYNSGDLNNANIFIVTTTSSKVSNTPRINIENSFKHRSLKSIEDDQDKILGIDEDITMEDLTTEFTEDSNASNIITKPARNYDAVIGVDDNFKFEMSTQGLTTMVNVLNSITMRPYEPDMIHHVTALNVIHNLTLEDSTTHSNVTERSLDKDTQKRILNIVNLANSHNDTWKNNDGMDLSAFFRMISTWFSSLASASLDDNEDNPSPVNPIMKLNTVTSKDVQLQESNKSDIRYPSYDSDMIENIGHRSRVLMSVDEGVNATEGTKENDAVLNSEKDQDKRTAGLQQNNCTTTPDNNVITTTIEETNAISEGDKNSLDNRTVAKRSIGDSGLVFWSDLYDDEYGIKVDPLEKELAGKNGNKGKEFMKRSKNWFQDKVKSIADNIKGFRNEGDKSNSNYDNNGNPKFSHVFKRQVEIGNGNKPDVKVNNFAELTIKMRNVVKEAAKAVQQTRKMQARESKDDSVSNGIMQQLVRMMSDLVNFQVQQKTCVKLPEDLQNFLEWITNPNQDQQSPRQANMQDNHLGHARSFEKDKDIDSPLLIQDKTECLETLHAVEDLIQQYDQMDDEDKSKMSGVRQYLENQLDFLNKQLSTMDEFNVSYNNNSSIIHYDSDDQNLSALPKDVSCRGETRVGSSMADSAAASMDAAISNRFSNIYANQPPSRFRRHLTTQKTSTLNRNKIKRRTKRKLRDFIRNFGRKHTKQAFSHEIAEVTENVQNYHKNTNFDKNYHNNNAIAVTKLDKNFRTHDKEVENKVHKSNTLERQDKIKSFREEYVQFKDNNKEFDKIMSENENSNNYYRNNDESEQNDDFYNKDNRRQVSYNKDHKIEKNDAVMKRNLQDVYYRALNEAKKVTTMKNNEKSDSTL